ncbi:MAG TPA: class I SAM-dependent methyltransferase [Actinomycetota bacterium]|nr:class I SAM-dependent methyltransferase [Actinomycetota bacterium]
MSGRPPVDVIERLLRDRPAFHSQGAARWDCLPGTLAGLRGLLFAGAQSIEIGCGASTVIFAAAGAYHTVISPDAEEHRLVAAYCEAIGVRTDRVTFRVGYSDDILPELCRQRFLDIAFIDGAHSFPYPEVDWHYLVKALKVGGTVVLDDIPIPSVAPLYKLMCTESHWRCDGVFDRRAGAFTLLAAPPGENWSDQAFNRSYPDNSFLPLRVRASATLAGQAERVHAALARRIGRGRASSTA